MLLYNPYNFYIFQIYEISDQVLSTLALAPSPLLFFPILPDIVLKEHIKFDFKGLKQHAYAFFCYGIVKFDSLLQSCALVHLMWQ